MQYSLDHAYCFELIDSFGNKLLLLQGLLLDLLLDRSCMRAYGKVVLNYLPRNIGDIKWLPCKHNDIHLSE